jgi:hypothetical protein
MFGYEFIGWEALSEALANEPLALWIAEHILAINIALGIAALIAKLTPSKRDDEFWAGMKERFNEYTGKKRE